MAAEPASLTVLVVSSFVGGVAAYLGAMLKNALDLRGRADEALVATRSKLYADLWARTARVPRWPREERLSYAQLRELSIEMRDWYFESGGIYMSRRTQRAYQAAQEAISRVVDAAEPELERRVIATRAPDYEAVRGRLSALRTEMTADLMSRRSGSLWWPF